MADSTIACPHYITLDDIQIRLWHVNLTCGTQPVVAFAGLTESAEQLAKQLAELLPGRGIAVIEVPGIGSLDAGHLTRPAGSILADALNAWGVRDYVLVALNMAAGYLADCLPGLTHEPQQVLAPGLARARAWAAEPERLPDLAPRQDGSHLTAFWCHLRDYAMLTAADLSLADSEGDPLPEAESLHACMAAAAMSLPAYAQRWQEACTGMAALPEGVAPAPTLAALSQHIEGGQGGAVAGLPATAPLGGGQDLEPVCANPARANPSAPLRP